MAAGQIETAWVPKPKQARLLETARELGNFDSLTELCKQAGVQRSAFYRWMDNDPDFHAAWVGLWKKSTDAFAPLVNNANIKAAIAGDVQAQRLFYQRRGELKEQHELAGPGGSPLFDEDAFLAKLQKLAEDPEPIAATPPVKG